MCRGGGRWLPAWTQQRCKLDECWSAALMACCVENHTNFLSIVRHLSLECSVDVTSESCARCSQWLQCSRNIEASMLHAHTEDGFRCRDSVVPICRNFLPRSMRCLPQNESLHQYGVIRAMWFCCLFTQGESLRLRCHKTCIGAVCPVIGCSLGLFSAVFTTACRRSGNGLTSFVPRTQVHLTQVT